MSNIGIIIQGSVPSGTGYKEIKHYFNCPEKSFNNWTEEDIAKIGTHLLTRLRERMLAYKKEH